MENGVSIYIVTKQKCLGKQSTLFLSHSFLPGLYLTRAQLKTVSGEAKYTHYTPGEMSQEHLDTLNWSLLSRMK